MVLCFKTSYNPYFILFARNIERWQNQMRKNLVIILFE